MRFAPVVLVALSCLTVSAGLAAVPALAERMESGSYVIQFGNFNITSGEKSSASYTVTDTVGQTGAGPYGQYGSSSYFVGGGFQYIYQTSVFSFQLSKTAIDLGILLIGDHRTDSHTMTISTSSRTGYKVYAYEEHPLQLLDGTSSVANTSCDSGTCDYTTASIWTNLNVSGFGFNVTGDDVASDFINSTYFRPFADASIAEPMQPVMQSTTRVDEHTATVTYKAGISGTETPGKYSTAVVYVAVPSY